MKISVIACLLLTLLLFFRTAAHADRLLLTNGDRLTGTVLRREGGSMVFRAVLAGEVTVSEKDIQSLETDAPPPAPPSPAPPSLAPVTAKPKYRWSGNLSTGLNILFDGNSTRNMNINLRPKRESATTLLTLDGAFYTERVNRKTTQENGRLRGEYSVGRSARQGSFRFLNTGLWRDRFTRLSFRSALAGGVGRAWEPLGNDALRLRAEAGGGWIHDDFIDAGSRNRAVAQTAFQMEARTHGWQATYELTYYPEAQRPTDHYLFSVLSLRRLLSSRAFLDTGAVYEYDSSSAPGERKNTQRFTVGLGTSL